MWDFLTFNYFITPHILLVGYYFGAILMPFLLWKYRRSLLKKYTLLQTLNDYIKSLFSSLSDKNQRYVRIFYIVIFFMMELMWRMIFEAMIGYFNMHNYLQHISSQLTA